MVQKKYLGDDALEMSAIVRSLEKKKRRSSSKIRRNWKKKKKSLIVARRKSWIIRIKSKNNKNLFWKKVKALNYQDLLNKVENNLRNLFLNL